MGDGKKYFLLYWGCVQEGVLLFEYIYIITSIYDKRVIAG